MTITLFIALVLIVYLAGWIIIEIIWSEKDAKRKKKSITDSSEGNPGESENPYTLGEYVSNVQE